MLDCRNIRTNFNCDSCYELTIENCSEQIVVSGGLDPSANYFINIFDHFDIKRTLEITTDENGDFEIDQSQLPDSFFNPLGNYDLYVSSDEDGEVIVPLLFDDIEYNCLIIIIE